MLHSRTYPTPCLRPELYIALGPHHDDLRIAIIEESGQAVGFFPFRRCKNAKVAAPIPGCDYQAIVGAPALEADAEVILAACNLQIFDFEHFLPQADSLARNRSTAAVSSPALDLSRGYEAYLADLRAKGTTFSSLKIKRRRMERDHGELRIECIHSSPLLERMLRWKAERFNHDRSWIDRVGNIIKSLSSNSLESPIGALLVLYAGETPVAVQFGLRDRGIFHCWLSGFNPAFNHYPSSTIMRLEMCKNAQRFGCYFFDLGPGGEPYKTSISNAAVPGLKGSIELPGMLSLLRKIRRTVPAPWVPIIKRKFGLLASVRSLEKA